MFWWSLTCRLPFRTCPDATCCTASGNMILTWPRSYPEGTRAPQHTACTMTDPTRTSMPALESINDAHCHHAVLRQRSTPYGGASSPKPNAPSTAGPSYGHTWTTGTSGSSRNTSRQPSVAGDGEGSLVVLGDRPSISIATHRLQNMWAILRDLNQAGLIVKTINDLLTMYVGAAQSARSAHDFRLRSGGYQFRRRDRGLLVTARR